MKIELHEDFVKRDAITLHSCPCVVLIGVRKEPFGHAGLQSLRV